MPATLTPVSCSPVQLRIQLRGESRAGLVAGEDRVLAAVRAAFGRARGFRVGDVLHQQGRAGALRRHAGGADGEGGEQAHALLPP